MTDALPSIPDYLGDDADVELVFDDDVVESASAAAPAAGAKPARTSRRKSARVEVESITVTTAPIDEILAATGSAEAPLHASAEEPAGGAPAPFPPHGAKPAGSTLQPWLLGIVALATVSSFASLGGLMMVSRTLAHAEADRAAAAAEHETLARIPDLVARLDAASARIDALSQRATAASPSGPPATVDEMRHELNMLKLALTQSKPDGVLAITSELRGGFQDLATRVDRIAGPLGGPRSTSNARAVATDDAPSPPVPQAGRPSHSSRSEHTTPASLRSHVIVRAVHPANGTAFKD